MLEFEHLPENLRELAEYIQSLDDPYICSGISAMVGKEIFTTLDTALGRVKELEAKVDHLETALIDAGYGT